jgi:hypothetical protein
VHGFKAVEKLSNKQVASTVFPKQVLYVVADGVQVVYGTFAMAHHEM